MRPFALSIGSMVLAGLVMADPVGAAFIFQEQGVGNGATDQTPDNGIRAGTQANTSQGGTLDVGTVSSNAARSLIMFDLSTKLTASDQIATITLEFTKERESVNWDAAERTIRLYQVAPFVEGTSTNAQATWNNSKANTPWTTAGGDFDSTKPLAAVVDTTEVGDVLTFATTPAFVAAAQDAMQNHGGKLYILMAALEAEASGQYGGFHQAEDHVNETDFSMRPKLTITLVPEPAGAMGLLGVGTLSLLGRWRSR